MRDLHFDGDFLRDFNDASTQWSWATWHEARAAQDQTARRLLEQVFGSGEAAPEEGSSEGEK